jgi:hypothetical protein
MHRSTWRNLSLVSLIVLSLLTLTAGAQVPAPQASYTVKMNLIFGSDSDPGGKELSGELSSLRTRLAADYGFKNFRVLDHQENRVSGTGATEVKGMTRMVNAATEGDGPTFLEWVTRMGQSPTAGMALLEHFRLGIRLPVRSRTGNGVAAAVAYEGIGVTVNRLNLRLGEPSVVGSFQVPNREGTLFIVLRVEEAGP